MPDAAAARAHAVMPAPRTGGHADCRPPQGLMSKTCVRERSGFYDLSTGYGEHQTIYRLMVVNIVVTCNPLI